ncbi:hypothetical protein [Streptomyces acidiscabies]|uniref:Uncharacterized protein n=1 Tax=Streptomyces acidiscabies TaxID=42234 RepID=A0AAP6EK53_9ACTN|nr:hypothetical protein [Streptomyces acidiscabies]MBP5935413.1 hypothetical protein [Streptomyces sp. LBUM 1476]MBZ3916734.1 hypothetical protein [Streptomyces acidiscabies]MDX2965628.1 hypothetical protein [Streptomyces acidiscabies]MDX3024870.1 hypothetical protein [Streptomyces acidiscabies]MDX3795544.1 hypothetical protein [Streptomyces acidiscabies]
MTNTDHDLRHDLHRLLTSCQDLADRHAAALAPYLDTDGSVRQDSYRDWEDERITAAIEASDHLGTVITHLTRLLTPTTLQTYTMTFAGLERRDGHKPTSFLVDAAGYDDARRTVQQLPGFREWHDAHDGTGIEFVPSESHPGVRFPGHVVDLRPEQTPPSPQRTPQPPAPPQPAAPGRHSR